MPIKTLKRHIKKHRPIDWFAMAVLISVAIVIASVLSSKVEQFSKDMDIEAKDSQANILYIKELRVLRAK